MTTPKDVKPTGVCPKCRATLDDHFWFIVAKNGDGMFMAHLKVYDQPQCPPPQRRT